MQLRVHCCVKGNTLSRPTDPTKATKEKSQLAHNYNDRPAQEDLVK